MKEKLITEIQNLKKEREEFIQFINGLDKRVEDKNITPYERDFLIKTKTRGSTAKAHLYDLNNKIYKLEDNKTIQEQKFSQRFTHKKPVVISTILVAFFLISMYTFLYSSTTGFFAFENMREYDVNVNQTLNESVEFYFKVAELTNNTQNITSLKITGLYSGDFAVYLVREDENGKETFNIYSSKDIESINSITGFATGKKKDIALPGLDVNDTVSETTTPIVEEPIIEEVPVENPVDTPVENIEEIPPDVTEPAIEEVIPENDTQTNDTLPEETEIIDVPFADMEEISFNNECVDTCKLELSPYNLSIIIEITDNSSLHLDYITFSQRIEETPIIEDIINETINETILNETMINETINETIINETIINETINQTINIEKIDPELLTELNSKQKVRVLIKKNGALQTVYVSPKDVSKGRQTLGTLSDESKEIKYADIKSRYPNTKDLTDEELKSYQDKKILDKNLKKPIEIEQETIDILASTTDIEQLKELSLMSEVEYITIDREFLALTTESMNITKIIDVKDLGYSGDGINVCVLDTGLNPEALGINTQNVIGYNFVDDSDNFSDNNGHGTKVVYPLIQSATGINLIIAKVISDSGIGYASDIIAGIEYCQLNNASIISASIGGGGFNGYCDEDFVASKINDLAINNNILTIAPTGNDGNELVKSPACARNALSVASSTKTDGLATFSNYNGATLLLAPGENIQTKDNNGNVIVESGTSMSVPFVTATAAMLLENNHTLTTEDLKWRIIHSGEIINITIKQNIINETTNNSLIRQFSRLNSYNAINNIIINNLTENNAFVNGSGIIYVPQTTATCNQGTTTTTCNITTAQTHDGTFYVNNLIIKSGGSLKHSDNFDAQNFWLKIVANGSVNIMSGGSINVTGAGYASDLGSGYGLMGEAGGGGSGAGYGGAGGNSESSGGSTYGTIYNPVYIGSGGGRATDVSYAGGAGGGLVILEVNGTLTIGGAIYADGDPGTGDSKTANSAGGGGSGGSIMIRARTINGAGTMYARGGIGGIASDDCFAGGGGGGGRIRIEYETSSYFGIMSAAGGSSNYDNCGSGGAGSAGTTSSVKAPVTGRGDSTSWEWGGSSAGETKMITGTPYSWNWTYPEAGSGRKFRNGTAYNWTWSNE